MSCRVNNIIRPYHPYYASRCSLLLPAEFVSDIAIFVLKRDVKLQLTRMWVNAQPDGRPAEHRWRPLFNAAKFG